MVWPCSKDKIKLLREDESWSNQNPDQSVRRTVLQVGECCWSCCTVREEGGALKELYIIQALLPESSTTVFVSAAELRVFPLCFTTRADVATAHVSYNHLLHCHGKLSSIRQPSFTNDLLQMSNPDLLKTIEEGRVEDGTMISAKTVLLSLNRTVGTAYSWVKLMQSSTRTLSDHSYNEERCVLNLILMDRSVCLALQCFTLMWTWTCILYLK